jgi:uridine kinase
MYFVAGVAGGAASGKTTVCDLIIQQLHDQRVVLVNQVTSFDSNAFIKLNREVYSNVKCLFDLK